MKVKTWHIGCLVILIAAALYFLVGSREGLGNSATAPCWGNLVDASTGSFISLAGENSGMGAIGTGPKYTTSADAQAACASDSTCTGVMKTRLPSGVSNQPGPPGYIKYTGPPEIVSRPYMKGIPSGQYTFLPKIPCSSSTTPPTASSMPNGSTGPSGATGGASMTPPTVPTPFPTPSSASAPSYSLTCTAAPVSGMVGSAAAMPETPAAWNVTQPPSGWNSKNGYTTTGN